MKKCHGLARGYLLISHESDKARNSFLLTWIGIVIAYDFLIFPFAAARYILIALPPASLLLLQVERNNLSGIKRFLSTVLIIFSLLWGFASAYSDYIYANTYREFAMEVRELKKNKVESFNVWYIGEWGMRYYMERTGCRYLLASSDKPAAGDFIVVPEMPHLWQPSPRIIPKLRLYATREFDSFPLKLFNMRSHAGFYAHHWGLLPFSFSSAPSEYFRIYSVS